MKRKSTWLAVFLAVALGLAATAVAAQGSGHRAPPSAGIASAWNVSLVRQYGGTANAVAVQGSYAYLGQGAALTVLDVSDPAAPAVVGRKPLLPDVVTEVAADGGYAYATADTAGLRIIDVSDPAQPVEIGSYDTPGNAVGLALAGAHAYVAGLDEGLRIVDISDPAQPVEVGFADLPGRASAVAVVDGLAYVADTRSLRVIDFSDPMAPVEVGYYETSSDAYSVTVAGEYPYVSEADNGLSILQYEEQPDIGVEPTALNSVQFAEMIVVQTLTIVNEGDADLVWAIGESPPSLSSVEAYPAGEQPTTWCSRQRFPVACQVGCTGPPGAFAAARVAPRPRRDP